jgi:hypothetical protein
MRILDANSTIADTQFRKVHFLQEKSPSAKRGWKETDA